MKSNKINNEEWKKSGISRKFPTYRNKPFVTNQRYLSFLTDKFALPDP